VKKVKCGRGIGKKTVGNNHQQIRHFTDLTAWKLARKLRVAVYEVIKSLPKEELYCLSLQMKKAAISCTANFAEGYGTNSHSVF